jgi:ABC-type multidrug transport system ATPase subunit
MDLIKIENLEYFYNKKEHILNNIDFNLISNEKNIIIGSNGSGKTTLLKCILGILKTENMVKIEGTDIEELRHYTDLSTNLEDALHISGDLKVNEFIGYHLKLKDLNPETGINLLEHFNLINIINQKISKLSSGQKRMLNNIVALASDSKITIMDEPASDVDPGRVKLLVDLINSRNQAFIITSHDLSLIKRIEGSTLSIMVNGRLYEKIAPGNNIFSMYISYIKPANESIEITNEGKNIYLTSERTENSRSIEKLDDLLSLYEVN